MKLLLNVLCPVLMVMLMSAACSGGDEKSGENETTQSQNTGGEMEQEVKGVESSSAQKPGPIVIKGSIRGAQKQPIYLQIVEAQDVRALDTVMSDENGAYKFELKAEHVDFYRVAVSPENSFYLVVEPGEVVTADADIANLYKSFTVSGSFGSARMKKLNKITGQMDSVNMILQAAQMNKDQRMFNDALTAQQNIQIKVQRDIKAFINETPDNISALAALQNLNPDADFDYFEKVITALDGKANGVDIYDNMSSQVFAMRATAVGRMAPDISMPQPNGEILKLSDLRGQYVMIDFWASWCGPCRRENPMVKKVYQKYHDKGFEIYAVALDKTKQAWTQAIEQDGLMWRHVSDLKYWQSEVVPEYQITGIPMTVLLDKEGKIIAKNLRSEALDIKLAQLLGE